ncbi:MarR family winged helix-turn-helix transcriptional regulator [Lactiplantibacillus carotarum]|uniref:MarR family winged helix-turn-helix transcriptional regulator n=1 Tax=Lactiplantibacillus carotarum TaxID=2993456 RepID=UPI00298EE592|nr:MarR family transcriptional regulator [Lactiplantibacillus carotarum]
MTQLNDVNAIGPKLKVLNTLVEKELNNTLATMTPALTGTQVAVLMTLADESVTTVTQKQMEGILHLSHPTTRGVIKRLVSMQLIATSKLVTDQRQVVLALTSNGRQFISENRAQINQSTNKVERKLVGTLSDEAQRQFLTTLATMIRQF